MANSKLEKSTKYPGVYWRIVARRDGRGDERLYYIMYRRPGSRKLYQDKLGRASDGFTEAIANRERAERIEGKESNTERRKTEKREKLIGHGALDIDRVWSIYLNAHTDNRAIQYDSNRYNRNIEPIIGKVLIADLQTSHIVMLRQKLEKRGLSPQTVKHCLALVKRILRYAAKIEVITMPACAFDMPLVDNKKTENMTQEQLAAYLKAIDEEPDQEAAAF